MALYIEVTNAHNGVIGRAGYAFEPGETKTVKVAASRANEVLDTSLLSSRVVSADSFAEIPAGAQVDYNATPAAVRLAEENGVDLFSVSGSGKGGQVTKDDVEKFASQPGQVGKTDQQHYMELHRAGGGSATVSTLDPMDAQLAAQHEALEELQKAEGTMRPNAGTSDAPLVPDQTAEENYDQTQHTPDPPADVERSEELQQNNPGAQEPNE